MEANLAWRRFRQQFGRGNSQYSNTPSQNNQSGSRYFTRGDNNSGGRGNFYANQFPNQGVRSGMNMNNKVQCQLCLRLGHTAMDCFYRFDKSFSGLQTGEPPAVPTISNTVLDHVPLHADSDQNVLIDNTFVPDSTTNNLPPEQCLFVDPGTSSAACIDPSGVSTDTDLSRGQVPSFSASPSPGIPHTQEAAVQTGVPIIPSSTTTTLPTVIADTRSPPALRRDSNQVAIMDSSREAFKVVAMNNKIKRTIRKEMISKRQLVREEEDVDDLAEAFIKNFHSSLNMEREELLKRLHERKNRRGV
ncbi:hypothetical protein F8388_009783 [Cannabis sativa]|uniref:Uncharacterized protein n=1 Tax=Cannabis sativa TaxID=3483 RepID=A0A7J6H502_CANSA|nr:hypothetical protein F8388_009783 [Cannabis sativa]